MDRGRYNCPLCHKFFKLKCKGCPIYLMTGKKLCEGTPYPAWYKHLEHEHKCHGDRKIMPKCRKCEQLAMEMFIFIVHLKYWWLLERVEE